MFTTSHPHPPLRLTQDSLISPLTVTGDRERDLFEDRMVAVLGHHGITDGTVVADGTPLDTEAVLETLASIYDATPGDISPVDPTEGGKLWAELAHPGHTKTQFHPDRAMVIATMQDAQLPEPSSNVVYTVASDVIDPLVKMYDRSTSYDAARVYMDNVFVGLSALYDPTAMGVMVKDAKTMKELANDVFTYATTHPDIATNVKKMAKNFLTATFKDFADGIFVRQDRFTDTPDLSFQRILHHVIMNFLRKKDAEARNKNTAADAYLMPFSSLETLNPTTIIFANAEDHIVGHVKDCSMAWAQVQHYTNNPTYRVVSLANITKLDHQSDMLRRISDRVVATKPDGEITKRDLEKISRSNTPEADHIIKGVMDALNQMKTVNMSMNTRHTTSLTYGKQSRRHPDVPDIPGKTTKVNYYPDIHFYVDTSGSISPQHYMHSVTLLSVLAAKLNINVYFSSFSNAVSQEIMVPTKNRSIAWINAYINAIPKVGGGTNFYAVYEHIERDRTRRERLNIMITDFGWSPGWLLNKFTVPNNLIYVPTFIPGDTYEWEHLVNYAQMFVMAMNKHAPQTIRKIIGVFS